MTATTSAPVETEADTVALGVFEGKRIPHDLEGGPLQALVDAGEAKSTPGHLAVTHAAGRRWVLVGLGARDAFDAERGRIAAAQVVGRCRELGTQVLCWELPHRLDDAEAASFVEGTLLAARRFTRHKSAQDTDGRLHSLIVSDHADRSDAVARAEVVTRAQNRARDLQERASNDLTPTSLAERALELRELGVEVEVEDRAGIEARGMGLFAAVAQGSEEEPRLITLRWRPEGAKGPRTAWVGKAVTHDTGGYSLKPGPSMVAMKFDMSGGAVVLEAVAAVAELGLPVDLVGVIGATDNMVDARAMKPGDVFTAAGGTTVEVTNTDAEGRLVLADCLHHAVVTEGAERVVDLATLTGGALTALGKEHCALFADDEAWATELADASAATGERLWRLPLHPLYAEQLEGRYADLVNSPEHKRAHPIMGAEFLHRFTGGVPWAHVDLTAAYDTGRPYAPKGGSGWGVRLLVRLASS